MRESFATGIQAGFRFVAIAAVLGFLISLFFVGGRLLPRRRGRGPSEAPA